MFLCSKVDTEAAGGQEQLRTLTHCMQTARAGVVCTQHSSCLDVSALLCSLAHV